MPDIGDFNSLKDQLKTDPDTRTSVGKIIDAVVARVNSAETVTDRRALTEGLRTQRDELVTAAVHDHPASMAGGGARTATKA